MNILLKEEGYDQKKTKRHNKTRFVCLACKQELFAMTISIADLWKLGRINVPRKLSLHAVSVFHCPLNSMRFSHLSMCCYRNCNPTIS